MIMGDEGRLTRDIQGEGIEYTFRLKLDPTKNPKHFDQLIPELGILKSIFEVNGDTLILCSHGAIQMPRPSSFAEGQLCVWKRKTAQKEDENIDPKKLKREQMSGGHRCDLNVNGKSKGHLFVSPVPPCEGQPERANPQWDHCERERSQWCLLRHERQNPSSRLAGKVSSLDISVTAEPSHDTGKNTS